MKITRTKEFELIYKEILNLIKEFFYINTNVASIWSLDIFITYADKFIGFTGTPLIHSIQIANNKQNENTNQLNSNDLEKNNKFWYINNDTPYYEIKNIYNIKYELIEMVFNNIINNNDLMNFLNKLSNSVDKYDCIIDVCGHFKNLDSYQISANLLVINPNLEFIVYIDLYNNKKILLKTKDIIDYDYKMLYLNLGKFIIYFDNRNIRGTDIENQYYDNKYAINKCIVIIKDKTDYNLIQQSIGRCRYFFNIYFYFILTKNTYIQDNNFENMYSSDNIEIEKQLIKMHGDLDILKELYKDLDEQTLIFYFIEKILINNGYWINNVILNLVLPDKFPKSNIIDNINKTIKYINISNQSNNKNKFIIFLCMTNKEPDEK